jgi:hypothetical protein
LYLPTVASAWYSFQLLSNQYFHLHLTHKEISHLPGQPVPAMVKHQKQNICLPIFNHDCF